MVTSAISTLIIGAQVHCLEGKCGRLAKVVLDPDTRRVISLIVEEGILLKQARVFPIEAVISCSEDDIYLSIHQDNLKNYHE